MEYPDTGRTSTTTSRTLTHWWCVLGDSELLNFGNFSGDQIRFDLVCRLPLFVVDDDSSADCKWKEGQRTFDAYGSTGS